MFHIEQYGDDHDSIGRLVHSFKRVVTLVEDEDMQKRWKYFLKNIKADTPEFSVVIDGIQKFLAPVFEAIVNEDEWQEQWNFIMK